MKKQPFFKFTLLFVVFLAVGFHTFGEDRGAKIQRTPGFATTGPSHTEAGYTNDAKALRQERSIRDRHTASEATQTRVFPWLSLSEDFDKELQVENSSDSINRSRVMVMTGRELATWDMELSQRVVSTTLPNNSSALAIRSLRPSRTTILWKRRDQVEWVDKGEEGPPVDLPAESYVFLLELRSEDAVAVQFELEGTDFKVVRTPQLRTSVSLLSRADQAKRMTRVVLLATDLQPLDSQFALFVTENAEALPQMVKVLGSDAAGNAVPVQVDFNVTALYSE